MRIEPRVLIVRNGDPLRGGQPFGLARCMLMDFATVAPDRDQVFQIIWLAGLIHGVSFIRARFCEQFHAMNATCPFRPGDLKTCVRPDGSASLQIACVETDGFQSSPAVRQVKRCMPSGRRAGTVSK